MSYESFAEYGRMPVPPGPRTRRRGLRLIIAAVAVLGLVVVALGGYLAAGVAIANADRQQAARALEQARQDNNQLASLVKAPDVGPTAFGSSSQDLTKLESEVQAYDARLPPAKTRLAASATRLHAASDTLQSESGNVLVAPERSSLAAERKRLESVITAFGAADEIMTIGDELLQYEASLIHASAVFIQVTDKLTTNSDAAGALAMYPQLDSATQRMVQLAKGPHIPPQFRSLTTNFAAAMPDFKRFIQAVQARDNRTVIALGPKLEDEMNGLIDAANKLDDKTVQATVQQLFQPYVDRYNAGLRAAGIQVVSA